MERKHDASAAAGAKLEDANLWVDLKVKHQVS
jgi:hypothetical protein